MYTFLLSEVKRARKSSKMMTSATEMEKMGETKTRKHLEPGDTRWATRKTETLVDRMPGRGTTGDRDSHDRECSAAVQLRIVGRVQGVGFRYSTQERAVSLGVCGRVRNETDGSVHVQAEGDPDRLAAFVAWCDSGPSSAQVDRVTSTETEPRGYVDFQISG